MPPGPSRATTRTSAGAIIDTDPYPANGCTRATICLTDAQLQAELTSYIDAHGLPHDLTHEYFMLTPPGVESCFEASGRECSAGSSKPVYCAYHGNIPLAGGEIIYANDPYVTGGMGCDDGNHPNGKPSDGGAGGRTQPRAQRVDHRPRTEQRLDGHRRQRRRDRRQVRRGAWASHSAKPPTASPTTR